ncbi:hypothetical protein H310_08008 [Aphanomyces invadans]|uniref:Dynactin subunit 6 n=1 Tax=Aphanomyces invadans TaxID=157072 RepID=A0A024U0Y0_9STRA|nr:hypothetical protein H310_08008 [Aphanomyces invadans]ETV99267.1 hypothetical protein H310_08008 [Aphanomyces invadans]|eukprot:XP_008871823.1 hypothetical protein H310_08008 [Aphanomyces invadans]
MMMFICDEATVDLTRVRIGAKSVLHPKSSVVVLDAPPSSSPQVCITIGERNILDDMSELSMSLATSDSMTVGDNNLFECGSIVKAKSIGNNNWFEPKCEVGVGVVIGDDCVIGTAVVVAPHTVVPNNTILVRLPDGRVIQRQQKEFARKAKRVLQDKYIDAFTEPTSLSYLPRNQRMKAT